MKMETKLFTTTLRREEWHPCRQTKDEYFELDRRSTRLWRMFSAQKNLCGGPKNFGQGDRWKDGGYLRTLPSPCVGQAPLSQDSRAIFAPYRPLGDVGAAPKSEGRAHRRGRGPEAAWNPDKEKGGH